MRLEIRDVPDAAKRNQHRIGEKGREMPSEPTALSRTGLTAPRPGPGPSTEDDKVRHESSARHTMAGTCTAAITTGRGHGVPSASPRAGHAQRAPAGRHGCSALAMSLSGSSGKPSGRAPNRPTGTPCRKCAPDDELAAAYRGDMDDSGGCGPGAERERPRQPEERRRKAQGIDRAMMLAPRTRNPASSPVRPIRPSP